MSSRKPLSALLAAVLVLLACAGLIAPADLARAATPPLVDDFESGLPAGRDANNVAVGFSTFQDPNSTVAISTTAAPPAPVPGIPTPNSVLQLDVNVSSYAGFAHNLESADLTQWTPQDWSAYEGISFWLYGTGSGVGLFVDVLDNRNPGATTDDAERWSVAFTDDVAGWREVKLSFASMARKEIGNGAPNDGFGLTEAHGWAFGTLNTGSARSFYIDNVQLYGVAPVRPLTVGFTAIRYPVAEGAAATITARLSKPASETVTVQYRTSIGQAVPGRDYRPAAGTLTFAPNVTQQSFTVATIDDAKYEGERGVQVELSAPTGGAALGLPPVARVAIQDGESFDPTLLDDFETPPYLWSADDKATLRNPEIPAGTALALPGQGAYERVLLANQRHGNGSFEIGRRFPIEQDWSDSGGLSLWYYGRNSGRDVTLRLTSAADPDPVGAPGAWRLVWSDEFNTPAGTAPDSQVWGREVGDGVAIGNPGWGNDELQYYTDSTANAATDGRGNLAITARQADGALQCYYGPCKYTSARLLSKQRFEVAYGRVEARIKVPRGAGLWPAFWMLGTDIDEVTWPQTGEIDIMEYVGRRPSEVFGTIHGPGYSGGQSYGRVYDFGQGVNVADSYHTFAVEWQPDKIVWYVDGIQYHQATPSDAFLQGKQWVFNHPFFMLLNVAVGGNFGGTVGADTTFPQRMLVDYVRLYQSRPRTLRHVATFRDDFSGWRQVTVPFSTFVSENGAPLDRASILGLTVKAPGGLRGPLLLDQIRLTCSDSVTVTSAADGGPGSLRKALGSACAGGTVRFAPDLAGQTIRLLSPLALGKRITVDASDAPGLTLSGGGASRVLEVGAGADATVRSLAITGGYGFELAGGIINNGTLTLDRVTVSGNTVASSGNDFWKGGGGIYSGDGSTLTLLDSTVSGNTTDLVDGGGIFAFFNTTVTIERSTLSGNRAGNVGGGIRSLGNVVIRNSTLSGNTSAAWHGGAIFHTDGVMQIVSSTIADNTAPDNTAGGIFVGTFTAGSPTLTLINSIVARNSTYQCQPGPFGAGTVTLTSLGHNLFGDPSCGAGPGDVVAGDPLIGGLADNGGPTRTHALLAGSPAIDAADAGASPETDQRGTARPQGSAPDIGAYEAP